MKRIVYLLTTIFCIGLISGCFDPPPGGVIEPDIDNIDLEWDIFDVWNDAEDQIIEWVISGTIANNDERTADWILIRGYFYDATGKYMQYHEKYEYDELLLPGESFDFEITWYWGDTEGDLIAEIDELPQEVTGDCEVINAGYASR